jgi:Zn-dependent protease with chaperone function
MTRAQWVWTAVAVSFLSWPGGAAAQSSPSVRDAELEATIRADVARAGEEAASLFDKANQARDGGDHATALELYGKVAELAPELDHPRRRACSSLMQLERYGEAVAECEKALALAPDSALSQSALAQALALRNVESDLGRAIGLARRSSAAMPDDTSVMYVWCQTALAAQLTEWSTCAERLYDLAPDSIEANHMMMLSAASSGDLDRARDHLDRLRAAGLPDDQLKSAAALLDRVEEEIGGIGGSGSMPGLILRGVGIAIGAWLAGLVLLFAAGWILSRLTMRSADRMATSGQASGDGSDGERRLRRIYRVVVLLCGLYFYLSVPVLLASVLVAGGGIIWLFFAIGTIPVKLTLLIVVLVAVSVWAIVRGLFVRGQQQGEPGHPIDLERNPRFRALLVDVAGAIQTKPVDKAYLTPHTDMAVFEQGGLWRSLRGRGSERCLLIGAGLLDGMKQVELRSILGHEYGHFRNQDTAGGGFALAVRRSLIAMIIRLAQSGAAAWYNPSWLFLRAYHRVYLVASQGASRLQEVLADRWAVRAFGSQAFIRGFTHVIERSVRFDRHVQRTLRHVIEQERPLANLYSHEPPEPGADEPNEADLIRESMEREPGSHDSHPAPRQRLAWAAAMAIDRQPEPDDDRPAWELFEERETLEQRMTADVRDAVAANHGLVIPAEPNPA